MIEKTKLILIFDNASEMDSNSYSLLLKVYTQCTNLCIITIILQDYKGDPIFPTIPKTKISKTNIFGILV